MYCHLLLCIASLSTLICEVEHTEQSLHSDPIQRSPPLRAFDYKSFALVKIFSSLATRSIHAGRFTFKTSLETSTIPRWCISEEMEQGISTSFTDLSKVGSPSEEFARWRRRLGCPWNSASQFMVARNTSLAARVSVSNWLMKLFLILLHEGFPFLPFLLLLQQIMFLFPF